MIRRRLRLPDPALLAGALAVLGLAMAALYGDRLAPFETIYSADRTEPYPLPPTSEFWLGTDAAGRDILSLILRGAGPTLRLVGATAALSCAFALGLALIAGWSPPIRRSVDHVSVGLGAIPALLAMLVTVVALRAIIDGQLAFIVAFVALAWAAPYGLLHAELHRLERSSFVEGVNTIGASRYRLLIRHLVPHLVPSIVLLLAQQVGFALVVIAELGLLGLFLGPTRILDFALSLPVVGTETITSFRISDSPDWSGLLAAAREVDNLYLSRWVFLAPAGAIGLAVAAVALLAHALARRYRSRDVYEDLGSPRARTLVAVGVAVALVPGLLPNDPHPIADAVSRGARAVVAENAGVDIRWPEQLLRTVGHEAIVEQSSSRIDHVARPELRIATSDGARALREGWGPESDFASVLFRGSGGGTVAASVVFVGWGVAPADHPDPPRPPSVAPLFGAAARDWADNFAGVDVHGAAALILRLPQLRSGSRVVQPPSFEVVAAQVIRRGAAAVLFVDPLHSASAEPPQPYQRLTEADPPLRAEGVPIVVITTAVADELLSGSGLSAAALYDEMGATVQGSSFLSNAQVGDPSFRTSLSRPLPSAIELTVQVARIETTTRSTVMATDGAFSQGALLIWAVQRPGTSQSGGPSEVARAVAMALGEPASPIVFVGFDAAGDITSDGRGIAAVLGRLPRPRMLVVIDSLAGEYLQFHTQFGELQLPVDEYARQSGVRYARTVTVSVRPSRTGAEALMGIRQVVVRGGGSPERILTEDAAAWLGYLTGRWIEGSRELTR